MTLTLEIPEDLAPRFAAIPESERPNFALAVIRSVVLPDEMIEPAEGEGLDELTEAVNEELAAIAAGEKGLTMDEVDARMKAKFPFLRERKVA